MPLVEMVALTYSWAGVDGKSGTGRILNTSYATAGVKTIIASITSGSKTIRRQRSVNVINNVPNLSVSCVANPSTGNVNDTITYSASVSGGNGNNTYSWTGTDGLSSNSSSASKQYQTSGSKTATVTVTSGSQTQSASCSAFINQVNIPITGSCVATPSNVNVGDNVTWTVQNVSGGNGNYTYSWSGTDGLSGNTQTVYRSYNSAGAKSGTVTVSSSNGQSTIAY